LAIILLGTTTENQAFGNNKYHTNKPHIDWTAT